VLATLTPASAEAQGLVAIVKTKTPSSLLNYASQNTTLLIDLIQQHGGVLIRGYSLDCREDLASLNELLYGNTLPFLGGVSPRKHPNDRSFEASIVPKEMSIPQHREKGYFPISPDRASFYCQTPAESGGMTPITDFEAVYSELLVARPDDMSKFEEEGICFRIPYWNSDYWRKRGMFVWGWQERFACNSIDEMDNIADSLGVSMTHYDAYSVAISRVPLSSIHETRKSRVIHPFFYHSRRMVAKHYGLGFAEQSYLHCLLNQCNDEDYDVYSGSGQLISMDFLNRYHDAVMNHTYTFNWQARDCVLLDNTWLGHGRTPYEGEREHWVALSNTLTHSDVR